jgi:hypothetical protein
VVFIVNNSPIVTRVLQRPAAPPHGPEYACGRSLCSNPARKTFRDLWIGLCLDLWIGL